VYKRTRQGNTIVAISPARLKHTTIRIDGGSLRDGPGGWIDSLGRAERITGCHVEVKNNALFYVHGKSSKEAVSMCKHRRSVAADARPKITADYAGAGDPAGHEHPAISTPTQPCI
jgi:hypothetical protein